MRFSEEKNKLLQQKAPDQPQTDNYKPLGPTKATIATRPTTVGNTPRKSKQGSLNPFSGHKHSDASKQKMSNSQKERYQAIRDRLSEERLTLLIEKIVKQYLDKNL